MNDYDCFNCLDYYVTLHCYETWIVIKSSFWSNKVVSNLLSILKSKWVNGGKCGNYYAIEWPLLGEWIVVLVRIDAWSLEMMIFVSEFGIVIMLMDLQCYAKVNCCLVAANLDWKCLSC